MLCEAAGIPDHENKMRLYGYIELHLNRLVFPDRYIRNIVKLTELGDLEIQNSTCEAYGKALVHYAVSTATEEEVKEVQHIIGRDGDGVVMFWTLTPYIYHDLTQRGCSPEEAVRRIFDWTREGCESKYEMQIKGEHNRFRYVREYEPMLPFKLRILGYDERMPSHLMSRLLSKTIARHLE